ncbi:collagen type V/XI/XXIV/XXVII, alpha [Sarotherodon galilaeus]
MRNKSKRVGRSSLCAVPTGSFPTLPQNPACPTGPKPATVTVKTRMVPDRKRIQNPPNQQNQRNLSQRPGNKCPNVIPTGLSPMLAERPLPSIPSKAPTVSANTRKHLPVNHMVPKRKLTQNHPKQQNLRNLSKGPGNKCPNVIPTGLSPMLAERPLPPIPSKAPTVSANTRKNLPVNHMVPKRKLTQNHPKQQKLRYLSKRPGSKCPNVIPAGLSPMLAERPLPPIPSKAPTMNVNTRKNLPVKHHMVQDKKVSSPSKSLPNSGKDTMNRGKSQNMFTDNEVVQTAATMKEELSVPVLSESPFDMTKRTSSQTISDQTVQDLPIESNELDRTNAGQPITDGSLSTNICKDNAEVVSAGSELESMDSESQDEKPKGKTGFQKFKRAVIKRFHRKKIATGSELQSIKGKTRFEKFKRAVKKRFNKKKIATSEAPDEESASPESMLTNDEVVQGAAFMKEQLSESPLDMTKKTSSQTILDQTLQDLPTENDDLDRTNAGQPFTDGSLSTNICDEDTTGKSLLKSGNDNNTYIDESQNTVFSEVFQKVSGDLYSLKMHIDFWKAKYASSVNADEFVEKETQQYLQEFFERRLAESSCGILKKKSSQTTTNSGKDTLTSGKFQNTSTNDEATQDAATMKEQLSQPVMSENPPDMTKKTSSQTLSNQTVQDLPTEHDKLDNTKAGQPVTDSSLSTDSCEDHSEDVSAGSELESMASESPAEKPKGRTPFQKFKRAVIKRFHRKKIATGSELQSIKGKTRFEKFKRAVKKRFHRKKIATSEAPDEESASPESMLTNDEAVQGAAFMKEQLSESPLDMTKRTSSQTISDQTVQDLPIENNELDRTSAGQPITDGSLSTNICKDNAEVVSAGSELESMDSESQDEKPKGKTGFQKFKRAVIKRFHRKKIATGSELQSIKGKTRFEKFKRAVKKRFNKKKIATSEAPDEESASPESMLTNDEVVQGAAFMKEQLSESPLDMTKKTSSQTLSDQTVQDLPTEHDKLDNTKAGQPVTDSSLSTDSCEDHSEDVSAGSELESMASESQDEKPKGKTPFQKFKRAVTKRFHKKKVVTGREVQLTDSESQDETPKRKTRFQRFKKAVKKLFHKKKTTSSEAPDDESARQPSASPESMLTNDEVVQGAAFMKEQLSESPLDMTKKTSTQTLSDQTVQDLPTEHDKLDNTKAGQPVTDSSLSTDSCEDHSADVSAGSELESMASESQDEKPKGKTPFQKFKRAVTKRFHKKKIVTGREVQLTDSESQDETPKRKTRFQRFKKAVKKLFHKKKTTSSETPDDESARQPSASPESMLTDDEAMQDAAAMKEQLSEPVMSENPPDMTKKTSTQTLSDQTVQDLPTEHDKLDNTKAGQPVTDSSLSTDSCEDHSEDVSAGSELESMASESHDKKTKGKSPFQKFKRAVIKRFHKKKVATSDAPDDESARQPSASPESTLTDDETTQDAATMKEQLSEPVMSENPPDMAKKTSTQTLSDQTVQDLPTEHDKLDNTKAGQPVTDSSLSTDSCEDHSEDVSAGSELESMASESQDEKPKGKTPFQKFKRAVTKRFHKRKIATGREVQSTDSEGQDETPKRKTRFQRFKKAVKKLFHKKKTTSSETPDDESARQPSASPESTLTDDETTQDAATMKEQLSEPVMSENPPDMTKKTSTQTLSDQTVQDLPTEHDKLDNRKAGQPVTDSSLSTDSCEDHLEDVSAGSELESMASESHDKKTKGKSPFQKFKRAVIKRFHKKKVATSDAPEDTPLTSNTFEAEAEGVAEDAKCSLNEEIDIEVLKKQFTEVCIDVLQYIRDSSITLSSQSNDHLPR